MKTIGLMPVRNEAHILPYTLPPLAQICDHIIIADQNSTDDTRAVIKKFNKAILIDNNTPPPPKGRFDSARPLLLDAARNFDGNSLLICIDADEITPPAVFCNFKERVANHYEKGDAFVTPWISLWKNPTQYYYPWRSHTHAKFFYDHRQTQYEEREWVHSGRVPHPARQYVLFRDTPVLHCHWIFWQRALWQQAWYQMMEFEHSQFDHNDIKRIHQHYHDPALHGQRVIIRPLPQKLRQGYQPPPPYPDNAPDWRKDEVWKMIEKYGIEIFEPLDIWYVSELKERFEQEMKRPPQWQRPPKFYVPLHQLHYALQWKLRYGTLRDTLKAPERAVRRTTWYKKLKGKKT